MTGVQAEGMAVEQVRRALGHIDVAEPFVRAFAWLDAERALKTAEAVDADPAGRALAGMPIGVKDVIDTAGIPTEYGTPVFAGRVPERSAACVRELERAGAVVVGKTVTAELAFAAPGPTRNPWNLERTPGGSSMGSAAGVAAGMLPAAIGTQTNSSVIMPAALCGVVGLKPSAGEISTDGVLPFSPTLDQIGCFARSVDTAAVVAAAMTEERRDRWRPVSGAAPRIAVARTSEWHGASPAVRARFEEDVARLIEAGARADHVELAPEFTSARAVHRTIMAYEAARTLGTEVKRRPEAVSDVLRRFLAEGAAVPDERYDAAVAERLALIEAYRRWADPYDAIATPAAPDEAPSRETTGDPRFCTTWTLVGAPALVLPTGLGPGGLPIGLQLVAAPARDAELLAAAAWTERALPPIPQSCRLPDGVARS